MKKFEKHLIGFVPRLLLTTIVFTSAFFAVPPETAKAAGSVQWVEHGKRAGAANLAVGTRDTLEDMENWTATSGPLVQLSTGDYVTGWALSGGGNEIRAQKFTSGGARMWGTNGVSVATHTSSLQLNSIVTDASGNTIFVYTRAGSVEIYAQKLNSSGAAQWTAGGLPVANEAAIAEQHPSAITDGSGGVIVAYTRATGTSQDIRAQRLDSSGAKQCGTNGTAVGAAANAQFIPTIVTDGSTGAIIGWTDQRSGSDIYAQRVNASCAAQWTANGVAIGAATGNQTDLVSSVADGSGGAVFTWHDGRGTPNNGIYAQKVNSSGAVQWTANGVAVFASTTASENPRLTMSATNVMIAFTVDDAGNDDLYINKLNASGSKMFGDGIKIADATADAWVGSVAPAGDGSTDVIVTWQESANTDRTIKSQRVSTNGDLEWTAGGVSLIQTFTSFEFSSQVQPYTISNSAGDIVVIATSDDGPGLLDVMVQRGRASDGAPQFSGTDGLIMPNGPQGEATQDSPAVDHDGTYSYVAWRDMRRDPQGDVYVQKFDSSGIGQWTSGGVAIDATTADVFQNEIRVLADGAGGAYVFWLDATNGGFKVLRLTSAGAVFGGWSSSGVTFTDITGGEGYLSVDNDGAGGIVASWDENNRVNANRVDGSGSVLWSATGTYVSAPSAAGGSFPHEIVSDNAGGAFIVFHYDDGVSVLDMRVVRLTSGGAVSSGWDTFGTVVHTNDFASYPSIARDGSNGVVVAWEYDDGGTGTYGIRAQRYNGNGNALWTVGGVTLANDDPMERTPEVVNSGSGSAIVAWFDSDGSTMDINAQKLDSSGTPQWAAGGVNVVNTGGASDNSDDLIIDGDGADGAVLVWEDQAVDANGDIRAQRVDANGSVRWGNSGLLMAAKPTDKVENDPVGVSDGTGGIMTAYIQEGSPEQISIQYARDDTFSGGGSGSSDSSSTVTDLKSDTMSRLKISTAADHVIRQTLPPIANFDAATSTDVLVYDFPAAFTLSGTWVTGDFTFDDGTARTVNAVAQGAGTTTVSCTNGANNVGVAIDTTDKVFRVRPCGTSYTPSSNTATIVFTILGTAGDGVMTNPSSANIYQVLLSMDDEGDADAFVGDLSVFITDDDQVTVSAQVNASMTFDIDTAQTDTESSAPYAVALGSITTADTRVSGTADGINFIWLDLDTNAGAGAIITVRNANGANGLVSTSAPGDNINSANGTMADGTENYGICSVAETDAGGNLDDLSPHDGTCAADSETNVVGGLTTTATPIYDTDGAPIASGRAQISVNAAISTSTAAHNDYTDTLTFIATGTF